MTPLKEGGEDPYMGWDNYSEDDEFWSSGKNPSTSAQQVRVTSIYSSLIWPRMGPSTCPAVSPTLRPLHCSDSLHNSNYISTAPCPVFPVPVNPLLHIPTQVIILLLHIILRLTFVSPFRRVLRS